MDSIERFSYYMKNSYLLFFVSKFSYSLKEQEKAKEAKDTLAGFKELADQAKEIIFYPLTKEYLKDEMMDKKRSSKRRKR